MMINYEDKSLIYALTLDNAIRYGGKPNKGSIIGRFIYLKPNYKGRIKDVIPIIEQVVNEVSKLPLEKQKELFEKYQHLIPKKEREKEEIKLPPLPRAKKGEVVTRFAPNPDFVLHLGSVRPLLLSYLYAKKYDGKFILRFEDTDPRLKKPKPEYYKLILDDIKWLGIIPDEIYYQSDRLEIYYKIARELIKRGFAYICTCSRNYFSQLVKAGLPCPHRPLSSSENMELFEKMLSGEFEEGKAVLRIKTMLDHPNPSIRDWPALRIINTRRYPHPRVGDKYFVWPLYNFSCAIDDHLMGITHVIRGAEHIVNEEKQKFIYHYMNWQPPIAIHHGRVAIPGGILSKSKILAGIKNGIFSGIDDPQLATLVALRRRGFSPEAIKRVIVRGGIKAAQTTIDWSLLAAENRSIIDKEANRYFGVLRPIRLSFEYPSSLHVKIRKHPDYPDRGYREITLELKDGKISVFIDMNDINQIKERGEFRLLAMGNFKLLSMGGDELYAKYIDNDVNRAKEEKMPFIHWISSEQYINLRIIYPEHITRGLGELGILDESVGKVIQLERVAFFKIEDIRDGEVTLIYTHD